jgi:hypothetical protein
VTTRTLPSRMRSLISDNDFSCTNLHSEGGIY